MILLPCSCVILIIIKSLKGSGNQLPGTERQRGWSQLTASRSLSSRLHHRPLVALESDIYSSWSKGKIQNSPRKDSDWVICPPLGTIQGVLDCDWPHQDHVTRWLPERLKYPRTRLSGRGEVLQGRVGLLSEEREKRCWGDQTNRCPWHWNYHGLDPDTRYKVWKTRR